MKYEVCGPLEVPSHDSQFPYALARTRAVIKSRRGLYFPASPPVSCNALINILKILYSWNVKLSLMYHMLQDDNTSPEDSESSNVAIVRLISVSYCHWLVLLDRAK